MALVLAFVAVILAGDDESGAGAPDGTGGSQTVDVSLTEFAVDPPMLEVPAGTEVIVNVTNDGSMPHDLKVDGETGTDLIDPGETVEGVSLGVVDAETSAWCTIPGTGRPAWR